MPDHSPTPWTFTHDEADDRNYVLDANGRTVMDDGGKWSEACVMDRDVMERAVRAVNLHDELAKALAKLVSECKEYDEWDRSATKNDLKRVYGEHDALIAKAHA